MGKIGVSAAVLRKPGSYTPEEYAEMRLHPEIGYSMLKDIDFLQPAIPVVRYHHERDDGHGYPAGLQGEQIPLEARLFAVADVFDALTSDRYYHPARSYAEARAMIEEGRGTHFDPTGVDAFCAIEPAEWHTMRARVAASTGYQSEFDADA
jgi:HD-GYP domain-containing protein (c-di-GMP phosphodiesterase class II)